MRVIVTDHAGELVGAATSVARFFIECAAATPLELASCCDPDVWSRSDGAARDESLPATAEVTVFDGVMCDRFDPHEIVSTAATMKVIALHGGDMPAD